MGRKETHVKKTEPKKKTASLRLSKRSKKILSARQAFKKHCRACFFAASVLVLAILTFYGVKVIFAADGSGTNVVSPTSATAGSAGNTFTFTFTATETMDSGEIVITAPAGFSAPQSTPSTAGYTTASSVSGMVATVEDTADSATGWGQTGGACGGAAPIADVATKHEGLAAISCANGNVGTGDRWYRNITSEDWSAYTGVGFWVRANNSIAAGSLQFSYDNSTNLASPLESISVGALAANTWTYVVLNFGATTRTAVVSYGLRVADNGGVDNRTVWFDDFLIGPGLPTFPGSNVISARILQLASTQTVTITYGAGGGTGGVVAPGADGMYNFSTKSRISDSGVLTGIATSPAVQVTGGEVSITPPIGLSTMTIKFSGTAFPEARVSLFSRNFFQSILAQTMADAEGVFKIEFIGRIPSSGTESFGLIVEDKYGDSTETSTYTLTGRGLIDVHNFFVPPTIRILKTILTKGEPLIVSGVVADNDTIKLELDGAVLENLPERGEGGSYRFSVNIGDLGFGDHNVRVMRSSSAAQSEFSSSRTFTVSRGFIPNIDINKDGKIDIGDWSAFLFRWGVKDAQNDFNEDGKIDIGDFSIFLLAFGQKK